MTETYVQRAQDAEALAKSARTPEERRAFRDIAAIWRRLAEQQAEPAAEPPEPPQRS